MTTSKFAEMTSEVVLGWRFQLSVRSGVKSSVVLRTMPTSQNRDMGHPLFVSGWRVGVLPFVVTAVDGPRDSWRFERNVGVLPLRQAQGQNGNFEIYWNFKSYLRRRSRCSGNGFEWVRHSRQRFARGANNPPFAINLQTHP